MAILHNSSVKAVTLNRISLVLSLIGLYVAGILSIEKWLGIQLPCSAGSDCSAVTSSPAASWAGIPVAFIGLFGYLILTSLSAVRSSQSVGEARPLVTAGLVVSLFGFLASAWFQYQALIVMGKRCDWCLTSAILMTALFAVHILLNKAVRQAPAEERMGGRDVILGLAGTLAMFLVVAVQGSIMKKGTGGSVIPDEQLSKVVLIPERANSLGDPNAKLTIVEFADLCCPVCQRLSPNVKELVEKYPSKVRLVYRHFPLPMHDLGYPAAVMAEYAADKSRFWQFASYFRTGEEPKDPAVLRSAAEAAGLDLDEFGKRMKSEKDPMFQRVERDAKDAATLGLNSTPTFLLVVPGQKTRMVVGSGLFELLDTSPYKEILGRP